MKLYIKKKFFSLNDSVKVLDINGTEKFYGKSDSTDSGKRLYIYDMKGTEVAAVEEIGRGFSAKKYFVYTNGVRITEIINKFSLLKEKYFAEGLGWEITGDFFARRFFFIKNGKKLVAFNKKLMSWGDCYEIDVENDGDMIAALAVGIAVVCIREAREVGGSGG